MSTGTEPIATLTSGAFKAEIYSCELPGEFTIRFLDATGALLEETTMTGVSSYRQRESEIMDHLQSFNVGAGTAPPVDLSSPGEY